MEKSMRRMYLVALSSLALLTLSAANAQTVGRTAGQFAVSPTGAATYTIPIWAPPGPKGIQPNISLVYNSQAGNGLLGVGWNLAGLSSISRCNLTYAQDGAPAPVSLATGDGYCLDGQRLRLTSGIYGTDGSTYQTEIANFENVTAHGAAGNGPAYFTVQTPDGHTLQYGNGGTTSNAQVLASGTSTALSWMLNQVSDPAGNTMTISYIGGTGSAVPNTISWTPTTHGASSYVYTMVFGYGANELPTAGYVAGTPVQNPNLLGSITINNNGAQVKQYVLTYQLSGTTGRDTLVQIQECAASTSNCLYPTTVSYQSGSAGVSTSSNVAISSPLTSCSTNCGALAHYDFNGDGYTDLYYCTSGGCYVAFGSASGFGTPVSAPANALIGDLLGTGQPGLLANNAGTWYYYSWNGSSFAGQSTGLAFDSTAAQFALVDIDGDGRPDLESFYASGGVTVKTRLNTSSGTTPSFNANAVTALSDPSWTFDGAITADSQGGTVRSFDFNGDGLPDVVLREYQCVYYSGGLCSQYATAFSALIAQPGGTLSKLAILGFASLAVGPVVFANVNNDACTDVIYGNSVYVSACDGVASSAISTTYPVVGVMDWNGDGLADLIENTGSLLYVQPSTGTGFGNFINTTIAYNPNCTYIGFDANGDGLDDLGCASSTSGTTGFSYYLHDGVGTPPDLVSSISDGYGNTVSPTYVSIVQHNYVEGTGSYPDVPYVQPIYVTNAATFSDPSGILSSGYNQIFEYYNSNVNLEGRGWDGFAETGVLDSRNQGFYDYRYYLIGFPYTGMQNEDLVSNGTNKLSESIGIPPSTVNYLSSTPYQQIAFPYFSNVTVQRWEVNGNPSTTQSTNYTYNNYGNATTIASTITDTDPNSPYPGSTWTTTTNNTSAYNSSTWCLNLFSETQVTYVASIGSSVTRTKQFTPDTTNCRYTAIVTEPSSSTYEVSEALGYDNFGNVNSDSVTGIDMPTRTTSINWNTTGQFPATMTNAMYPSGNPLAQTTQISFDPVWGTRTSVIDPNGILSQWSYDPAFGRLSKITRPDGTYTKFSYSDCANSGGCLIGSHGLVRARTVYNSDGSTMTDGTDFFDPVDRPLVKTQRTLVNDTYSRNEVRYDALGNSIWQAAPCTWSNLTTACPSGAGTTITYDVLNRVTHSQLGTFAPTSFTYSGRTLVTTDPNGHAKTTVSDVNGWLRQTMDANNYIVTLSYDAAGTKVGITDNQSRSLWSGTVQYGIAPFTTNVVDSALGSQTYTFDALGELTCWTNARYTTPCSFSETYDLLSRPVTRSEPDLFTQWTWGSTAGSDNIGTLASVCTGTSANPGATPPPTPTACTANSTTLPGYSENEAYDAVGRLSQRSITIPTVGSTAGGTYDYGYQYNTSGQLGTLTYPATVGGSPLAVQYAYNNGIRQSLVTDATTVWTANTTNAAGQLTEETLGNGVEINRSFDPVALWLNKITAGVGGGTALENQTYLHDPVGNVTERQEDTLTLIEDFHYDNLNRIICSTLSSEPQTQCGSTIPATNLQVCYDNTAGNCNQNVPGPGSITSKTADVIAPASYIASWTSYNYPASIANGTESVQFSYGPDRRRWQQNYNNGAEVTNYIGGLLEEVVGNSGTSYRHYVYAGTEPVAVVSRTSSGDTVTYMLSDQQASIAALVSSSGSLDVGESFTPYGIRRIPSTWSGAASSQDLATIAGLTRQGYTFQTALGQSMGFNHMNGRVEDAITGQFLSPDPNIPDPTNTQDYDRYSYVSNNPLSFVDPSGFSSCVYAGPENGPSVLSGCVGDIPPGGGFYLPGGDMNGPNGNFVPMTLAALQQMMAPELARALDELNNYEPPQTVPKTTCPSGFGGTIARFLNEVGQGGMDDGNTLMQAGFMTAGSGVIIAAAGGGGANPAADLLGGAFITGGGALTALGTINWGLGYAVKGVGALLSAALGNTQPMKSTIVQGAQSGLEDRLGIPPGAPSPLDPLGEKLAGTNPCP
jgi:RHS repeat-associated protein